MRLRRVVIAALLLAFAAGLGSCGGGEKQDVNEPEGTWKVDVLEASFPGRQHLADTVQLRIKIKNLEERTLPNLAVTVDGLDQRDESPGLADPRRPIWVIENPPDNSTTAFTNTWAVGKVPGGQSRTLIWSVTAVRAGTYTLRWKVAAGLDGKAKARSREGGVPNGSFIARVSDKSRPVTIE